MYPSCCVQFRSTVTVELLYPQEENLCLNRKSRHWKEQGKIDVIYLFFLLLRPGSGDLVILLPEKRQSGKGFIIVRLVYSALQFAK